MPSQPTRLNNLPPYVFSVIGDRIRQMQTDGIDVFRLDIGNPDMPPPDSVIETLSLAAKNHANHGYTGYRGVASFRQAIAEYYAKRFGVELHPDQQVLPLIGTKEGIVNLCMAYIDSGDTVLVPDIGYPAYGMATILAGGQNIWVPLRAENGFKPDLSAISEEQLLKAKILWVNYPNNPTGVTIGLTDYRKLLDICLQYDILLASDNPYMDIMFDGNVAHSLLEATTPPYKNAIEFFSFSKSYNMAGWRLGAAVGDAEAIDRLLRVKSNIDSGHFKAIYEAGITALQTPQTWIDTRNQIYQERRDCILEALPQIGLKAERPEGTLYIWAKVESGNVADYIEKALIEAHVSLAPGEAYGPGGKDYVRLSVGVPNHRLEQALKQLKDWYR